MKVGDQLKNPINQLKGDVKLLMFNSWIKVSIKLVRAECVRTSVVRALADIVAIKFGIIILSFSSFHLLFSQKGFAYDFEFLHAFQSN